MAASLPDEAERPYAAPCLRRRSAPARLQPVLGPGNAEDDPVLPEGWGPDRMVRAAFLVSLLCGAVEVEAGLVGAGNLEGLASSASWGSRKSRSSIGCG